MRTDSQTVERPGQVPPRTGTRTFVIIRTETETERQELGKHLGYGGTGIVHYL